MRTDPSRSPPHPERNSRSKHYEAVSYAWETQHFSDELRCIDQGSVLRITSNVSSMLRHLRKSSKPRYLWIDAICLNQDDAQEKSIQVARMGDIYHEARKVLVWLGEINETVPQILAFFRVLVSISKHHIEGTRIHETLAEIFGQPSVTPIEQFLQRPWFERRWILKEVARSHQATLHCGGTKFSWGWLTDALEVLKKACETGVQLSEKALLAIGTVCTLHQNNGGILDLMWSYRATQCSNPEDRIFALYCLANDLDPAERNADGSDPAKPPKKGSFRPKHRHSAEDSPPAAHGRIIHFPTNYTGSFSETYFRFAQECVRAEHPTQIFQHVMKFGSLSEYDPALPSWVPDWRALGSDPPFISSEEPNSSKKLSTGSRTLASISSQISWSGTVRLGQLASLFYLLTTPGACANLPRASNTFSDY